MAVASKARFESPASIVEFDLHVSDPVGHLKLCHEKIERSLRIIGDAVSALRLTEPVLRAEAAAALDYELALFEVLTAYHKQDEEQSLFPRLRAKADSDPALAELLRELESEDRTADEVLDGLAECLRKIAGRPGPGADAQLARLEALAASLNEIYRPHIARENEALLPKCADLLTAPELESMRQEMQRRYNG
jgi:hemerythrin-like domain-containing protein